MHVLKWRNVGILKGKLKVIGNIIIVVESLMSIIMGIGSNEHADSIKFCDSQMIELRKFY